MEQLTPLTPLLPLQELIALLKLEPLPVEGGYYRVHYTASDLLDAAALPARFTGVRALSGAIYYLITPESFSSLHKLRGDELWHHYYGDSAEQFCLYPNGEQKRVRLGTDFTAGDLPSLVVPGGVWQGTRLVPGGRYALFGTTMAPAYAEADFTPGERDVLIAAYPEAAAIIKEYTYD
jgi:uncharacterized protein